MRKLLVMTFLVSLLAACGTARTGSDKDAAAHNVYGQVVDSLKQVAYTVHFDYVMPQRMTSRFLTTDYSLHVQGDSVVSYLPYFGVAYRADIGNERESPLVFRSHVYDYQMVNTRKNVHAVSFKVKRGMELLEYRLDIFPNGKADLLVNSTDRESIRFTGKFNLNK
jgi:hypothetical protein